MFASTCAKLANHSGVTATIEDKKGNVYEILRRFDFDHNTMTQSVIVQLPNGDLKAIVKGSGEAVGTKCKTIPSSYKEKLSAYSKNGVYQIAVGWKDLPSSTSAATITRAQVESELEFLGLLNFSNQMREETPAVITQLKEAGVQPIMLTGDNLFTGVYVARQSGIIPKDAPVHIGQLEEEVVWTNEEGDFVRIDPTFTAPGYVVLSGEAWCHLLLTRRKYAISLAPSIRVVGRCSPQDKVSVVDTFVNLGFVTLMVSRSIGQWMQ
jgi:magnesium-transporting ATPase (P-type)